MPQAIPFILLAVSVGASTYGVVEARRQAKQQAAISTAVGQHNAKVERNRAIGIQQEANFRIERLRSRNRRLAAKQRNQLAKSGTALVGTALDLQTDTALESELDILNTIHSANLSTNEALANANSSEFQGQAGASLAKSRGNAATVAGVANIAGTLGSFNSANNSQPTF